MEKDFKAWGKKPPRSPPGPEVLPCPIKPLRKLGNAGSPGRSGYVTRGSPSSPLCCGWDTPNPARQSSFLQDQPRREFLAVSLNYLENIRCMACFLGVTSDGPGDSDKPSPPGSLPSPTAPGHWEASSEAPRALKSHPLLAEEKPKHQQGPHGSWQVLSHGELLQRPVAVCQEQEGCYSPRWGHEGDGELPWLRFKGQRSWTGKTGGEGCWSTGLQSKAWDQLS